MIDKSQEFKYAFVAFMRQYPDMVMKVLEENKGWGYYATGVNFGQLGHDHDAGAESTNIDVTFGIYEDFKE